MTWRLDTISITNFKAFKNEQTIELNGKNYLLYGDNGSGKSSIFWSLYTLYQSCYKKEETKVRKYFDVTNDENLLNRYVSNPDSSIVATFMDVDNAANIKEIKMSNNDLSIVGTTDTFTIATVTFSDFFNYQKQSSLFDYCNSEDNDVFKPFLRDLFPFIKLRNKMVKIDGNEVDSDSAFEAWTYLVDAVDKELKNDDGSLIYEEDDKYKKYQEALYQFNEDFKIAIEGIEGNVGRLLHSKMELPNVNLLFEYKEATFNDTINGNGLKDGKLHAGKILISAEDTNIADANKRKIKHPRTYFNEATLSKIALAIRLAVFENKASFYDSDGAKLLFVDDLLVTFDMRNRIDVMNILLGYAESYQLLIFTHDRAFYNMFKNHLLDMEQHKKWKFAQIYMQGNGHQVPKIVEEKSNLDMAKKYFDENDCVASAVYLRKECEKIAKSLLELRYLCAENVVIGKIPTMSLGDLLNNLKKEFDDCKLVFNFCDLSILRKDLMNISVHDDAYTQIYRNELEKAIVIVEKLRKIKRTVICDKDELERIIFDFTISEQVTDGRRRKKKKSISFKFCFLQTFSRFVNEGNSYYQNAKVKVTSSAVIAECPNIRELTNNTILNFQDFCTLLDDKFSNVDLGECVSYNGTKLKNYKR